MSHSTNHDLSRRPVIAKALISNMGKNGFFTGPTDPQEISSLSQALDDHQRALYIIEHKKRPVPSFEAMKAEVERVEDSAYVKERIEQLRAEHIKDLELLYDIHANDYLNEVMDRYASKGEVSPDDIEGTKALERLDGPLKDYQIKSEWTNDYELLRYTYLTRFLQLKKQQKELEDKEAELERRRAQMFPQSIEDFKTKPTEIKLRAARFLAADRAKQEKMLTEFQWAWRQVKPLQDVFAKDDKFRSEIQGMIISADTRDPRKRASINL